MSVDSSITTVVLNEVTELTILDRTKRVKEARDEAKKEIEAYRKTKDDEFKKFESEVLLAISHRDSRTNAGSFLVARSRTV